MPIEGNKTGHRNMAVVCWVASWILAIVGGMLFAVFENIGWDRGIYWALTTVTTVGYGDITPHNLMGYVIADSTMVLTIPIWSVAIAFATSWFTSWHIWDSHDQQIADRRNMHEQTQAHISSVVNP